MSTNKKATAKKEKQGNLMYLGPTITGVVRHSTVFKNGVLSKKVNECVEKFPVMKKLFATVEDVPYVVKELNKTQSALRTIYSQTAEKFSK